ncbi:hypothetical protein A2982_01505 [candidate division WWE3 bacterium RIFCSPLOWO2_01_FULL_39_13]|uniref:Uncharacterized protein n=1 Tax=candidate division WWE3 bacterium RIFCSPLOWO2_01_FULL_39_13 TaxID=1802624 RepID=A0A1F4V4L5_UNCKA|nr:MAG: hypothetical protein A2982_01505 [candidate division WWE3 bacterium RIFCSPLOWO2_01_FULL_39_13]
MDKNLGVTNQKSDLLAVILSFSAGVIQLLLFVLGTASQITNWNNFFAKADLVPLSVLLSMIIALTLVGIFSYHQKNKDFVPNQSTFKPILWIKSILFEKTSQSYPLSKKVEKTILNISLLALFFFCYLFVASTISYLNKESYFLVGSSSADFVQIISFMVLWIVSTFILFVWISNEIEKSRQYKPNEFVPNFIRTLQNQGYINITISDDIQLQDGNHLVKVEIQGQPHFFITQFDGTRIVRTISEDDFKNFFVQSNQS